MDALHSAEEDEETSKILWKKEKIAKSTIDIDGVQTNICLTQNNRVSDSDKMIIFIPGNPGAISFYKNFLEYLFDEYQVPIYGISHAGKSYFIWIYLLLYNLH